MLSHQYLLFQSQINFEEVLFFQELHPLYELASYKVVSLHLITLHLKNQKNIFPHETDSFRQESENVVYLDSHMPEV